MEADQQTSVVTSDLLPSTPAEAEGTESPTEDRPEFDPQVLEDLPPSLDEPEEEPVPIMPSEAFALHPDSVPPPTAPSVPTEVPLKRPKKSKTKSTVPGVSAGRPLSATNNAGSKPGSTVGKPPAGKPGHVPAKTGHMTAPYLGKSTPPARLVPKAGSARASSRASSEDTELICNTCYLQGNRNDAEGFCQDCSEFLCGNCLRTHRKSPTTQKHVLIDKASMMKVRLPQSNKPGCTEVCRKHKSETVNFFCKEHDKVGCGKCMLIGHKTCSVEYVPDIAENFTSGAESHAVEKRINVLDTKISSVKQIMDKNNKEADLVHTTAVNEIKAFRKEVDAKLDKMEKLVLDECEKRKQKSVEVMKRLEDEFKTMKQRLEEARTKLHQPTKQAGDLFVQTKLVGSRLKQLELDVDNAEARSRPKLYKFKPSQNINNSVIPQRPLGTLVEKNQKIEKINQIMDKSKPTPTQKTMTSSKPKRVGKINIKSASDNKSSWVSGLAEVGTEMLALSGFNSKSVKLVDIKTGKKSWEVIMNHGPWDITTVAKDRLAVTVPEDQSVQFLSITKSGITLGGKLEVDGKCFGIAYSKERFIVSFTDVPKVEILNMDGAVLQLILTDKAGGNLFAFPLHVAADNQGDFFCVSDRDGNSVTKLTFDGTVLHQYKDPKMSWPEDLVVCNDGSVLVCSKDSVFLLTSECKRVLGKKDGCDMPRTLGYIEDTRTLYLCNTSPGKREEIEIYKFS